MKAKSKRVIEIVENYYGLIEGTVLSKRCNSEHEVKARHVVMAILRRDMTLKEVGKALGGRHHTTIIHGVKQVNDITHPGVTEEVKEIMGKLILTDIELSKAGYVANVPDRYIHSMSMVV